MNKIGALQFGLFQLSSGKVSPYYIDLRIVPSFPDVFQDICSLCVNAITTQVGIKNFDRVAGVPIAGLPFASQIAYALKKPFLYARPTIKQHGRERRVEGILVSGDQVLVVDDLATTGLTIKNSAQAVRAEGGVVTEAVAFLDREEGATELLEENGIKLHSFLRISEIANTLYEFGALDDESLKTILKQIKKK